jgi:hypothetical protein
MPQWNHHLPAAAAAAAAAAVHWLSLACNVNTYDRWTGRQHKDIAIRLAFLIVTIYHASSSGTAGNEKFFTEHLDRCLLRIGYL